jgi:succinate-semialdehyde dehydrogenase/glutarate-semialdehyde dehydrogenase
MLVIKQPIGVVGTITPWNFPASMVARKISPALAAGCTIVLKPAEQTPLVAGAMFALAAQAGFPDGVVNLVYASEGDAVGRELCGNPKVRKISFTGSTEVGRLLMRQCSDQIKKVSLELGGNAPFIVFDDADVDAAVDGAIQAKFRNARPAFPPTASMSSRACMTRSSPSSWNEFESFRWATASGKASPSGR